LKQNTSLEKMVQSVEFESDNYYKYRKLYISIIATINLV